MAIISSIIIGLLNAYRGGNYSAGKWYDIIFSKWLVVLYFYAIAYFNIGWLHSLYFIAPIVFMFLVGTGALMQAFTTGIINNKEFAPIDWLTDKIVGIPTNLSSARRWGVWFGTIIGLVYYIPFIVLGKFFIGLPVIALGLYCGAMRYFNTEHKWRLIEFGYFVLYSLLIFI